MKLQILLTFVLFLAVAKCASTAQAVTVDQESVAQTSELSKEMREELEKLLNDVRERVDNDALTKRGEEDQAHIAGRTKRMKRAMKQYAHQKKPANELTEHESANIDQLEYSMAKQRKAALNNYLDNKMRVMKAWPR